MDDERRSERKIYMNFGRTIERNASSHGKDFSLGGDDDIVVVN